MLETTAEPLFSELLDPTITSIPKGVSKPWSR